MSNAAPRIVTRPAPIHPALQQMTDTTTPVVRLSAAPTTSAFTQEYPLAVAFPPERIEDGFGEYIAAQGSRQLRLAETEKYAHVTFFFNGGRESARAGWSWPEAAPCATSPRPCWNCSASSRRSRCRAARR